MNRTLHLPRNLTTFGIPFILLGILITFIRSSFFSGNETLNFAVTADLLVTVPFLYFLLIRKRDIPKTTIIPVMIIGLLVGSYFLPKESQTYLSFFKKWLLPVVELSIVVFVMVKVRSAIKKLKSTNDVTPDFFTALKSTCAEILPKRLVIPFATEVAVFYYGFIYWKSPEVKEKEFKYHKESGTLVLFGTFVLLILIETFAIHLILFRWSLFAAWILTALSFYTAIQIFGIARSLSKRPISINNDTLSLKYGVLYEAEIRFLDIEKITLSSKSIEKDEFTKLFSPLGELESHNVIIHLKNEIEIIGFYGLKKKINVIAMHLDEPVDFKQKLERAITRQFIQPSQN
jgi:hypothetical protein